MGHGAGRLALLLLAGWLAGCGREGGESTEFLSIGTGGTGGVYYPYGGGLAELWNQHVPGIQVVAEVTGASLENVKLAHRGETKIGEIMGDVAHQAYHGEGKFDGNPQQILALAVMYPNILQVATLRGSGVENLRGIRGQTVSIGAPGSGTAIMSDLVLETLGISRDSFTAHRLSFKETADALRDHTIDVGVWCVASSTSSLLDLSTTHDIRLLSLTPEEQRSLTDRYSYYSAYELEAGTYRGVDRPVTTISVWNVIICTAGLEEQLVYDLTRVLFEQIDYLQKIHPMARFTTPENTVTHGPIPLHPGALRYLRELGLEIPDHLVPGG